MIHLQILDGWRSKRVVDPQIVDDVVSSLSARDPLPDASSTAPEIQPQSHTRASAPLSRNEIIKRIEEDRERHKRLRERRWVQPISHSLSATPLPLTFMPLTEKGDGEFEFESGADIEFDNEWETVSDWNEDDDEACKEENELCFGNDSANAMDLS